MPLPYRKLTQEQDDNRGLLPAGTYQFIVHSAEHKPTRSGEHDQLVVELDVIDSSGVKRRVKDWLVFIESMDWKFRHFAKSCNLLAEYDAGSLEAHHFLGKDGVVEIATKDIDGKKYNNVKDYIVPPTPSVDEFKDDDIKF